MDLASNDQEHACAEKNDGRLCLHCISTCASCAWFETNKSKSCPAADSAVKSAPDTAVFVHLLLRYWGLPPLPPTFFPILTFFTFAFHPWKFMESSKFWNISAVVYLSYPAFDFTNIISNTKCTYLTKLNPCTLHELSTKDFAQIGFQFFSD